MILERDRYIKLLMEKYNMYNEKELYSVINNEEYDKLIELQLDAVRKT